MKQKTNRVIYGRMKKTLSFFAVLSVIIVTGMLAGCKGNTSADLVVYGKIFTSETNQIVEAFAVKDKSEATYFEGKKIYPM